MGRKIKSVVLYINAGMQSNPVDKWGLLLVLLILSLLTLVSIAGFLNTIIASLDIANTVFSTITVFLVLIYWLQGLYEKGMMCKPIDIVLIYNGKTPPERLQLEYKPLRSEISRSEVQGILGMYFSSENKVPSDGSVEHPIVFKKNSGDKYDPRIVYNVVTPVAPKKTSRLDDVIHGKCDVLEIDIDKKYYDGYKRYIESVGKGIDKNDAVPV